MQQTQRETLAADVQAGVDHLRGLGVERVLTLGFCFGGSASWVQSADTPGLAGCIGFYGGPQRVPAEAEAAMTAPLLMLAAGADAHIPVPDVQALADRVPVDARLVVFDGAPHSFFDRTAPEHADACVRAWGEIRTFVDS